MDLDAWLEANLDRLLRFAYLQCGSTDSSEDAVQDVIVALLRRRSKIEANVGSLDAYARRAVVNQLRSQNRRHRRVRPYATDSDGERSLDLSKSMADHTAEGVDLLEAISLLGARRRAALVLRFYEDRPYREIGQILDCTDSSARSLVTRALNDLRENGTLVKTAGAHGDE